MFVVAARGAGICAAHHQRDCHVVAVAVAHGSANPVGTLGGATTSTCFAPADHTFDVCTGRARRGDDVRSTGDAAAAMTTAVIQHARVGDPANPARLDPDSVPFAGGADHFVPVAAVTDWVANRIHDTHHLQPHQAAAAAAETPSAAVKTGSSGETSAAHPPVVLISYAGVTNRSMFGAYLALPVVNVELPSIFAVACAPTTPSADEEAAAGCSEARTAASDEAPEPTPVVVEHPVQRSVPQLMAAARVVFGSVIHGDWRRAVADVAASLHLHRHDDRCSISRGGKAPTKARIAFNHVGAAEPNAWRPRWPPASAHRRGASPSTDPTSSSDTDWNAPLHDDVRSLRQAAEGDAEDICRLLAWLRASSDDGSVSVGCLVPVLSGLAAGSAPSIASAVAVTSAANARLYADLYLDARAVATFAVLLDEASNMKFVPARTIRRL